MSEFDKSKHVENSSGIDFRKAKKLVTTGSICDAYETRHYRRHVFVKRLKPEFQTSPRHLAALEKEYEIGVNLNHPGLPHYTEFHEDYIVMDFIDGMTLASMISKSDSRLQNPEFVIRVLNGLLDIIEYLHLHNIYHNDIKADNIIITSQSGNPVLIDFDKCYTSWLDDTPGSSDLYGVPVEKTGSPEVDYHGLGKIAEKIVKITVDNPLKQSLIEFAKSCCNSEPTIEELRKIIGDERTQLSIPKKREREKISPLNAIWLILGFAVLFAVPVFLLNYSHKDKTEATSTDPVIQAEEPESAPSEPTDETVIQLPVQDIRPLLPSETEITGYLSKKYEPLHQMILSTESAITDKDPDSLDKFLELNGQFSILTQEAYKYFESKYPEANPVDIQLAVVKAKKYREISGEITRLSNILLKFKTDSI